MTSLSELPHPSEKRLALYVKPAAVRALRQGHPWLFDKSIQQQKQAGNAGDLAVVFDNRHKRFLAIGLYDPDSPIRVKILQHNEATLIDREFFARKLSAAIALRKSLESTGMTGYRLVHGENDGLPGLIIDRYSDTLVIKLYTAAWIPHLHNLLPALEQVHPAARWVLRLSRALQSQPCYGLSNGQILKGESPDGPVIFRENGLTFAADVIHGHKTGFFFDQRDNRLEVSKLSQGRRVLDVFAYTGGFSVYAAYGGASEVWSMDSSEPALTMAQHNFRLNQDKPTIRQTKHELIVADAFERLERLHQDAVAFDMVIVDPPAFAKSSAEIQRALAAYQRLAESATRVLRPQGILVMSSCSSRVSAEQFCDTVQRSIRQTGRRWTELKRSGHALDHPISFPEGAYLKCVFGTIE